MAKAFQDNGADMRVIHFVGLFHFAGFFALWPANSASQSAVAGRATSSFDAEYAACP
jgi:hypothetical protein